MTPAGGAARALERKRMDRTPCSQQVMAHRKQRLTAGGNWLRFRDPHPT